MKFAFPDRQIDRFASDREIRCRTLRITRGKENVETARGTRHTIASRVAVCGRAALRLCVHMYLDCLLLTQPQTTVVVQSGKMHATRSAAHVRAVSFDNAPRTHARLHACMPLITRRVFDIPNCLESVSITGESVLSKQPIARIPRVRE